MTTLLLPLVLVSIVAALMGRSLSALGCARVRWWPLGMAAVMADLVLARIPVTLVPWLVEWGHWLWIVTVVCAGAVLARNVIDRRGIEQAPWIVATLGVGMNLLVVFANGGFMPMDVSLLDSTGVTAQFAERPRYRRDVSITSSTNLPWLGDVMAAPGWLPMGSVISIGDVLLDVGLGWWLILSTDPKRVTPRREVVLEPA